ncbi:MAG: hypothetical protein N3B21_08850 [Clostridia bacterium]|nr:hypothetical protein [Clostridia bacterium]
MISIKWFQLLYIIQPLLCKKISKVITSTAMIIKTQPLYLLGSLGAMNAAMRLMTNNILIEVIRSSAEGFAKIPGLYWYNLNKAPSIIAPGHPFKANVAKKIRVVYETGGL